MTSTEPYKVVVFGAGAVGKSSIVLRFVTDHFSKEYLPTIEDCYRKHFSVDGETAFLDILDTAGQEEYTALRDQWVREGKAFLLVYSVTSRESFDDIPNFRDRILMVAEKADVPMVLVGNKSDLEDERIVTSAEGRMLAKDFKIPFVECSALTGTNCASVFHTAVREIRKVEGPKQADQPKKRRWCSIL